MKFLDTYHKFNQIRAQNPFRNGPHDEEVKWEERAKKDSGIDKFTQKQGLSKEFEEYISYNTASNINSYETKANVIKLYPKKSSRSF